MSVMQLNSLNVWVRVQCFDGVPGVPDLRRLTPELCTTPVHGILVIILFQHRNENYLHQYSTINPSHQSLESQFSIHLLIFLFNSNDRHPMMYI